MKADIVRISAIATAAILLSSLLTMQQSAAHDDHGGSGNDLTGEIGVLVYTHGDMMNHEGTPNMDKMMAIDGMLEKNFKTPSELIFHMPYDWDDGLVRLDEKGVSYAIFMYTDMFGPDSTVIHNLTRGVFGGIDEYNVCPGVPMGDGCMYMGALTEPASKVSDTILVFAEPARPDHPILKKIFVKQAKAVSENPQNEVLVLVGHGAKADTNDAAQEKELSNAAMYVEMKMGFADSIGVTAREDWPNLSPAAVQQAIDEVKTMLEETGAERVVLVPATGGSGFVKVATALEQEGIDFVEAPGPLPLGEKEFKSWAKQVAKETIEFIEEERPTESTITPYWDREYYPKQVSKDDLNDATNGDSSFDIKRFGIDSSGDLFLSVKGEVGSTVPEGQDIYGYVFVTDAGTYAVTAHLGNDTPGEDHEDNEWHAHKVTLEDGCISSITPDGEASIQNKAVLLSETSATSISEVMTIQLTEQDGSTCITEVFDQSS